MKILYVGPLWKGSTSLMRLRAFQHVGHEIVPIDTSPPKTNALVALAYRAASKLGYPLDLARVNDRLVAKAREIRPKVIWIDKGLSVLPRTLETLRDCVPHVLIAGYSPDDMGRRHNQSRYFLRGLPLYDVFFTTKSFNVAELADLGARQPVLVGNGYDPAIHRPLPYTEQDQLRFGGAVGFVGAWEQERASYMEALASKGVPVRMWGWQSRAGWAKGNPNIRVENQALWGDDYARAICHFDINLCFLRKMNRDKQTTRSVEIPACGAFMLAERTDEHLALFEEGKEAEFFESKDELVDKTWYYLTHDDARRKVAEAGRRRCLVSGYSYHDRAKEITAEFMRLRANVV